MIKWLHKKCSYVHATSCDGQNSFPSFAFRNHKEDELELMRDFEIKKKSITADLDPYLKLTFHVPASIHDVFRKLNGTDFR